MLTDAELASMRAMQALTFDQVATVTRRSYVEDGMGGQVESSTTATLPCRVAPPLQSNQAQQRVLGGQLYEGFPWRVTFAAGADVQVTDAISAAGHNFEVTAVLGSESRETARVVLCTDEV